MNAVATALNTFTRKMVGALILIAALTLGGAVGNLTNGDNTAHATTTDSIAQNVSVSCTGLLCPGTVTGQGGEVPTDR